MRIQLTNGETMEEISPHECKPGDSVYFVYTHHLNPRSSMERIIPASFIRYIKGRDLSIRKAFIQRLKAEKPSRISISKIFRVVSK